jgi:hypothetical protein
MIPVDSLLYKIDQKLNKLSTNEYQQIQLEDKILALNEAQIKLVKQKLDGPATPSTLGLDAFRKRYEDLQKLIENYEDHPLDLVPSNPQLNQWTADLTGITPSYMFYMDAYVVADKGRCTDRTIWINRELVKHGDIPVIINNTHYRPSFEYQETFSNINTNQIMVYSDGTFTPKKLYLSYLRYPRYIDKVGYVHFDGTDSVDSPCELAAYLEDELVDLTVENLAMYTENASAVQSAEYRIRTNE